MISFLLNFILVIIFIAFIIVCLAAYRIYRSVQSMREKLASGGKRKGNNANNTRENYNRQAWSDNEVIIDQRPKDKINRKIFSKSEGEYVDFEEETD